MTLLKNRLIRDSIKLIAHRLQFTSGHNKTHLKHTQDRSYTLVTHQHRLIILLNGKLLLILDES